MYIQQFCQAYLYIPPRERLCSKFRYLYVGAYQ